MASKLNFTPDKEFLDKLEVVKNKVIKDMKKAGLETGKILPPYIEFAKDKPIEIPLCTGIPLQSFDL